MDGGHQAFFDAKRVVQHFGKGGQTVGGTGSIRYDVVEGRVVGLVIHTDDKGGRDVVFGGRGNDHFSCTIRVGRRYQMTTGFFCGCISSWVCTGTCNSGELIVMRGSVQRVGWWVT